MPEEEQEEERMPTAEYISVRDTIANLSAQINAMNIERLTSVQRMLVTLATLAISLALASITMNITVLILLVNHILGK